MINDERRLTDPHHPYQGICSPLPSPVVLLLGRHNSVSPCGAYGPCSNPTALKCPRTGRSKNCRLVQSSWQFPLGAARAPRPLRTLIIVRQPSTRHTLQGPPPPQQETAATTNLTVEIPTTPIVARIMKNTTSHDLPRMSVPAQPLKNLMRSSPI